MTVVLLAAMEAERARIARALPAARAVRRAGRAYRSSAEGSLRIVLAETGIGKVNAAVGAVEAIRAWRPDALVSSGVAGGLAPDLAPGDVVAASAVAYHDVDCGPGCAPGQVQGLPARFPADPALLARARAVRPAPGARPVAIGPFASGDEFVSGAARRDAVLARVPDAVAVDMESGALAQVCHLYGVPFLSFRVLSDTPGATPDHVAQWTDFWGELADRSFGFVRAFLDSFPR